MCACARMCQVYNFHLEFGRFSKKRGREVFLQQGQSFVWSDVWVGVTGTITWIIGHLHGAANERPPRRNSCSTQLWIISAVSEITAPPIIIPSNIRGADTPTLCAKTSLTSCKRLNTVRHMWGNRMCFQADERMHISPHHRRHGVIVPCCIARRGRCWRWCFYHGSDRVCVQEI